MVLIDSAFFHSDGMQERTDTTPITTQRPRRLNQRFDARAELPDPGAEGFLDQVCDLSDSWFLATPQRDPMAPPLLVALTGSMMQIAMLVFIDAHPAGRCGDLSTWILGLTYSEYQRFVEEAGCPHVEEFVEAIRPLVERFGVGAAETIWLDVRHRFAALVSERRDVRDGEEGAIL